MVSKESNQLDCQIWRVYDLLHRTSVFCETMEECQHLIQHFVNTEVEYFKSMTSADNVNIIYDDDIVSPLGYEVVIHIDEKYDATEDEPYSYKIIRSTLCHYIYYHDRDEEESRAKIEKELRRDHPWIFENKIKPPTLKLSIDGEDFTFVPENSDDWYPF